MNFKKALSLLSAAAMAASCFSGVISVSAKETTAEIGRIYNADEICDASGNTETIVPNQNEAYYNDTLGAPFGDFEDLANYPKQSSAGTGTTWESSLTYDITTEGTYTFSVFVVEYNNRYPTITLDGTQQLVDGTTLTGLTILGTYGSSRSLAIIQCKSLELDAGQHTITMANIGEKAQIQGVIAAVLTDDNAAASTPSPKPTAVPAGTPFTQVYKADGSDIVNGSVRSSSDGTYTFVSGMDDIVYDMFKDDSNAEQVNAEYTANYINFIGNGTKPEINNLNLPEGTYKIYYVGYNNDGDFTAEIDGETVGYTSKSEFAKTATKTLNMYTFDVSLEEPVQDGTLAFNRSDYWLPDLYAVGITNEAVSYSVSGTVSGADDGYSFEGKTLKFTSARGKEFTAEIDESGSFAIELPKAEYTVFIDDIYYRISSGAVEVTDNMSDVALTVEKEESQEVKVTLINPPAEGTTITLGETPIEFSAGETEKTINLAPGSYEVSSSNGTMSELSKTALTVSHDATYKNIYFPEDIPAASSFNVTVGPNGEYKTISDALEGIAKLGTPTADNRATITLEGGQIYREQVQINIPYVTITAPADDPATITWYYGIGNTYYSLGANGRYDKDRAMTKIDKLMGVNPASWGSTVLTNQDGIRMENVKIENSFNQYYTDEEFADGAEPNGAEQCGQMNRAELKASGIKADSTTATERAAALYSQGKNCEFYNCTVISSQDTIGTGGTMYFKDCTLVGNTDYICSGGNCVFDNCDLLFGGYSDTAKGGALTAAHTGSGESYIFRDCTIGNYGEDIGRQHGKHSYGRDWGGADASVYFFNTTIEEGTDIFGWGDMGGAVNAGTADLHVYNFDAPNEYTESGSDQNNINKVLTFNEARAKYEGALDALGFKPAEMVNAESVKTASEQDTEANDYVYGIMTEVTTGENSAVSNIKWTISDGTKVYNVDSKNLTDTSGQAWEDATKVSGGATANYILMFHAPQGNYDVLSQAQ